MAGDDRISDLRVTIDGNELSRAVYDDLVEVVVEDDAGGPSMATLRMLGSGDEVLEHAWIDDDQFSPGHTLCVELGEVGAPLSRVFSGEITGLEMELGPDEGPSITVRAYDLRHRLLRGTKTRSFVGHKDSEIAEQIAKENNLAHQVTDSRVKLAYVLQAGQSDLEFLKSRAAAIGFEVAMDDEQLAFRPRSEGEEPAISLAASDDLLDIHVRLAAGGPVGEVRVQAWDPARKQAMTGSARAGDEPSMGETPGSAAADKAFGKAVVTLSSRPVGSQEEADAIALAALREISLGYVSGEGTCVGNSAVRAGRTVSLVGLGKRMSGAYYVTQATHSYSPKTGYLTRFSVRRNAT